MSVDTQEGARELLRTLKEQWALLGINHLVHAFIVGPGANVMGCSDDGEPSGTAGRPVLEVLKGTGMTNVPRPNTLPRSSLSSRNHHPGDPHVPAGPGPGHGDR